MRIYFQTFGKKCSWDHLEWIRTCPDPNGGLRSQYDRLQVAVDEIGHSGQNRVIKLGARLEPSDIGAAPANRGVD